MVRIPDDSDDDQPPDPASPTAESDSDERPLAERRSRQNRSRGGVSEGDPARARSTPRSVRFADEENESPGTARRRKRGRAIVDDDEDGARDGGGDATGANDVGASGRSSSRPRRASAAASLAAMSGRKLDLRRGLRDDSDYDEDDEDDDDDDDERELSPPKWERNRSKSSASPAKPRGRNVARRKSSSRRRSDLPVPEYTPVYQGGPGVDPRFYEYRPKVKVAGVNAERVSSEEELSSDMDDFIAPDDEDVEEPRDESGDDDDDDDDDKDDDGEDVERGAAGGKTSDDAIEIDDDDDDDDGFGKIRRKIRGGRRRSAVVDASESSDTSSEDDVEPPSVTAIVSPAAHEPESARSRRLRRRSAALSDGDGGDGDDGKDSPVTTNDGATNSATPGRRQRLGRKFPRSEEDVEGAEGAEGADPDDDDDETAGEKKAAGPGPRPGSESAELEKRTSSRISSRRALKSEIWREHVSELKEKMGREEAELREIERADEDAARTQGDEEDEEGVDNFIVFDEENVDFFEDDDDDENDRDDHPTDDGAFPGEINGVTRSPAKEEFQWVACECGATTDDGRDDMIRCCNARCGVWQHVGCVDGDPDGTGTFFCANCAAQGGHGADPPPGKPSRLGRGGGAFASVLPRTQTAWSQRMARALASDDFAVVDELLRRHPQPPSRGAMLCRAAVAGAAECVRLLVGKTSTVGIPLASKKEIGRALHKALAAGHRPVVEAIRAALGEKLFVNSSLRPHDAWPLGPNGYTLVHSAAANAKADPGCVWLALEATGEPPGPSDEFEAFNAAAAARAVPPPPPPPLLRKSTMGEDDEDDENTKDDDENTKEEKKDANTDRGGVPEPSFTPSAATTAPLLGPLALLAHGPFYADRPAAAVSDEAAVTPLMLAAGAGVGYEGCVSALLRSAQRRRIGVNGFDVGASISLSDEESRSTAAHYAAQSGSYATLRLLAQFHPPCVEKGNYNGETPLHHAAANGQEECIRVLTDELGVRRTVADKSGWIPLLYADYAHRRGAVLTLMAQDLQEQLGAMNAILDSHLSRAKVMKVLRMIATVPPFYDALNAYIRAHIALLSGPLSFLLTNSTSHVVDFANRRCWLQHQLNDKHRWSLSQSMHSADFEPLAVAHSDAWGSFRRWVLRNGTTHLTGRPLSHHCSFRGMPARGPGVERDLLDRVAMEITRDEPRVLGVRDGDDEDAFEAIDASQLPQHSRLSRDSEAAALGFALLRPASEGLGVYHPPNLPDRLPAWLEEGYAALGWLLGYCVLHQSPFPVSFSSAFLKGILGRATAWEDLEEMAPEVARSLESVRDMDGGVEDLCLTFSVEEEESTLPAESLEDLEDDDEASENDDPEIWWSWRRLEQMPSDRPMLNRIAHWVRQQDHAHVSLWRSGSMHVDRVRTMLESEYRVDLGNRTDWLTRAVEFVTAKTLGLPRPATRARREDVVDLTTSTADENPGGVATTTTTAATTTRTETELVPGGSKKTVTDFNKDKYVRLHARHKLDRVTKSAAIEAVRHGLLEIVPLELLKHFTAPEFACLLGGVAAIDVHDWRANARYDGYDEQSPQVRWLWRLVHSFTPDERTLLLKFATGSSRMPVGGFANLRGFGSDSSPFTVQRTPLSFSSGGGGGASGRVGAYCLPTAATCFNTLRLPEYPTYEALEEAVTIALRHGVEGFAFG